MKLIEFDKMTVNLVDNYYIKLDDYHNQDKYAIIPKSYTRYTRDIDWIESNFDVTFEDREEFNDWVRGLNNDRGYEYIEYWTGSNWKYIATEVLDCTNSTTFDFSKYTLLEIEKNKHYDSPEYALLIDEDENYYIVFGCTDYQNDLFPEIELIGKTKTKWLELFPNEED